MPARLSLIGQRFTRLVVVADADDNPPQKNRRVHCRCDCGTLKTTTVNQLRTGKQQSCGCLRQATARAQVTTHGKANTPEWNIWCNIIQRCTNPKNHAFVDYGGRGITIAPIWRRDFPAFLAAVGPRPTPEHTIDRIHNDQGYEPGNVRWATRVEQARNTRSTHWVVYNGERVSLAALAAQANVPYQRLWTRRRLGWAIDRLLDPPR